ncbi:MAG: type I-E CRISPR-associated protein Cas7/Cse4/CasC [Gammaproteobacteria bacterium]
MEQRFLQIHLLTSYPPSNLNRDDLGRPKTAVMGGANRLRVSSQSLKRAWRTSSVFEGALNGHVGTRTKEMGHRFAAWAQQAGASEKNARAWAREAAAQFGALKTKKDDGKDESLEIEQLAHFGVDEFQALEALAKTCGERGEGPSEDELKQLNLKTQAADIALFGRMLAAKPSYNVEAAAQVAHAISVHRVTIEDDYFTAVDDLNDGQEDAGAGHLGETEFAAGLFYLYLCLDRHLLLKNLGGDEQLASQAIQSLLESAATVAPSGKQNSFGSRARASYILCETGNQQPRSLSVAFLKPVQERDHKEGMGPAAVQALTATRSNMDKVYGACAEGEPAELNAFTGQGSLDELKAFACC